MIVQGREVAEWVCEATGGCVTPHTQALGWMRDGQLIAAVSVEGWNGRNAYTHQRIINPPPRAFWVAVADYVFNKLGCARITGLVDASNHAARRLDEHIGFVHEAVLTGSAADGGNQLVMVLWRDQCRFLKWEKSKMTGESRVQPRPTLTIRPVEEAEDGCRTVYQDLQDVLAEQT